MNEKPFDKSISPTENVTRMILEAKIKDLPFAVLKGGFENVFTREHFDAYNEFVKNGEFGNSRSRIALKEENFRFFPGWDQIQRALVKIYGNPTDTYSSIMRTSDFSVGKVHASLHLDTSDVVHLCCYGRVEWLLVDPNDKKEYTVVLEPGDMLYMRGYTLHETVPLSDRGSLIFMNLSYEEFPDYLTEKFLDKSKEEVEAFQKEQRAMFLEHLNKGYLAVS